MRRKGDSLRNRAHELGTIHEKREGRVIREFEEAICAVFDDFVEG
jgi:hypothetical protein